MSKTCKWLTGNINTSTNNGKNYQKDNKYTSSCLTKRYKMSANSTIVQTTKEIHKRVAHIP